MRWDTINSKLVSFEVLLAKQCSGKIDGNVNGTIDNQIFQLGDHIYLYLKEITVMKIRPLVYELTTTLELGMETTREEEPLVVFSDENEEAAMGAAQEFMMSFLHKEFSVNPTKNEGFTMIKVDDKWAYGESGGTCTEICLRLIEVR